MKLAIFDVDGTLSDSQDHIVASVTYGFEQVGLSVPPRHEILSIVGLSLPEAMARLAPQASAATQAEVVTRYKDSYRERRLAEPAPLYPGAQALLARLAAVDELFLGIATGKSRRGLDGLLRHHGIAGYFVTRQTADDNPSKPAPGMVLAALQEAGVTADDAVMIGDTTFDMEMGRAAGVATIAVNWGYHPVAALEAVRPSAMVSDYDELAARLSDILQVNL